ncbi:MAG: hypothetical protein WBD07_17545 [Vicinamibacterales bacterium]
MKKVVWAAGFGGLMLVLAGCSPVYYVPNAHNVPMLQGKGDGTFGVHAASFGGEVQGAFAIAEHIGVMVNVAAMKQQDDGDGDGGSGGLFEVGVGYHRNLGSKLVWENYLLLGGGNVENHFPSTVAQFPGTTGKLEAKFTRYGVQPSIAQHSRFFDSAFSVRLLGLQYRDVSGNLTYAGVDQVAYLNSLGSQFLIEPAFTFKAGWDPIKLQLQLGFSQNMTTGSFRQREAWMALGLVYDLRRDRSGGVKVN